MLNVNLLKYDPKMIVAFYDRGDHVIIINISFNTSVNVSVKEILIMV